jgi:hypothetical protein
MTGHEANRCVDHLQEHFNGYTPKQVAGYKKRFADMEFEPLRTGLKRLIDNEQTTLWPSMALILSYYQAELRKQPTALDDMTTVCETCQGTKWREVAPIQRWGYTYSQVAKCDCNRSKA